MMVSIYTLSAVVVGLASIPLAIRWPKAGLAPTLLFWMVLDLATLILAIGVAGRYLLAEWNVTGLVLVIVCGAYITTWRAKQLAAVQPKYEIWIEHAGVAWALLPACIIALIVHAKWRIIFVPLALWALHFFCGLVTDAFRRKVGRIRMSTRSA